ncbi:MAG: methyltransferase domain-containing protein [Candidatus Eisenbacteria bacterium]
MIVPALAVGAWELAWLVFYDVERKKLFTEARAEATRRGKPLLVVGAPDPGDPYGCGDVVVDLRPAKQCKRTVRTSIESMPMFKDKEFGACFCAHVLEHVCQPLKALLELHRVADTVHICRPRPWTLTAWVVPGHAWLMVKNKAGGFDFLPLRDRCNVPTRQGS